MPEVNEPTTADRAPEEAQRKRGWATVIRDAALISVVASAAGLASNAVRTDHRIAWVQPKPYDILVPCPEPVGEPTEMSPDDPLVLDERSLVIDARTEAEFTEWHIPESMNLEFDWLGPPIDQEVTVVARKVAQTGAHRVVIYGDGDDPDSGREWAKLLSGARIKNVHYVQGGGPALMERMRGGKKP